VGPDHLGIPGNEKADAMVYKAATSVTSITINKIPTKDLLNEALKWILRTCQIYRDYISNNNKLRNIKNLYQNGYILTIYLGETNYNQQNKNRLHSSDSLLFNY